MALDIKPVLPSKAPPTSKSEAPAEPARNARPRRQRSAAEPEPKRPPKSRATRQAAPPLRVVDGNAPYSGEQRIQASIHIYPSAWATLERRASELIEAGERTSAAALLVALLHFHMPADGDTAAELVQDFRQRLAGLGGTRAFEGEHAAERNVRLFRSQRERLDELGREIATALHLRYGRMLLLNTLLDEHAPSDRREAGRLLQAFELVRAGVPEEGERLMSASASSAP